MPSNAPNPGQGRGRPDDIRGRAHRQNNGRIEVGNDRLEELEEEINWDDLSPIEEYLLILARR